MTFPALICFFLFGATILGMYIAIRRNLAPPGLVAAGGVLTSIITMSLFSLAQGNVLAQAILVGIVLGGAFSVATLVIAMYFQGNERRTTLAQSHPQTEDMP